MAVCSKDRADELRRLVHRLKDLLSGLPLAFSELIVVEDISVCDRRPEPVAEADRYIAVDVDAGFGLMRQTAVEHAGGEVVVFIDDDCLPCEGWLTQLLQPFEDRDVVAVGGGILPQAGNAVAKATALIGLPAGGLPRLLKSGSGVTESDHLSTGNLALWRQAVVDAGGFDCEHRFGGEDQKLVGKLDGKKLWQPAALVAHRNRETFGEVWQWFTRRGRGEYAIHRLAGMGRIEALLSPLRWSWSWRLLLLVMVGWGAGMGAAGVILLLYYLFLLLRIYLANSQAAANPLVEAARGECLSAPVLLCAPLLKLCMDFGREYGRMLAMCMDGKHE